MVSFSDIMEREFLTFAAFLAILWFLAYWILGGVFFALVTIMQLRRVRKVTFSCLFTLLAGACATAASWFGIKMAHENIGRCLVLADTRAEAVSAIFGCGFVGIFGTFLIGAAVLVAVGFIIYALASSSTKSWFEGEWLEEKPDEEHKNPAA